MMAEPTDAELSALELVVPDHVAVSRGPRRVLLTLSSPASRRPLVTWALVPAGSSFGGALLAEWAEYVGGTAATALRAIGEDHDAPVEERIRRVADGTAINAQLLGDDFDVEVEEVHTRDPADWFG